MSSLNLVPNPAIMAVEAGIFLANLVVVKKLLLEPYLKVYTQRIDLTKGSHELAEKLDAESARALDTIQMRVQAAVEEGKKLKENVLVNAKTKRDSLVDSASKEAQQTIESLRQELAQELELQRQKIPTLVNELTRQLLEELIPA